MTDKLLEKILTILLFPIFIPIIWVLRKIKPYDFEDD